MVKSTLVLAVAGSRKTQSIVESCAKEPKSTRILVLTYTTANQNELVSRLKQHAGTHSKIEVSGWFSFLITHIVRPYVPFVFPGRRVLGFDFESQPQTYSKTDAYERYFTKSGSVRKVHLPQLAHKTDEASKGAAMKRLARLYDKIYIDEVQDLCGYDLEILLLLMKSGIPIEMVGDVRQAVLATNAQEKKNSQFMFMNVWKWFLAQETLGNLTIVHRNETWRCRPEISLFADSLFGSSWGFEPTISRNNIATAHDGLFAVTPAQVDAYIQQYAPLVLRYSKSSRKEIGVDSMNYKISKGLTRERVLVIPTGPVETFLLGKGTLKDQQAAELYVAVTRAEQSVAFVISDPTKCQFQPWFSN